jgi:hypothetical protein
MDSYTCKSIFVAILYLRLNIIIDLIVISAKLWFLLFIFFFFFWESSLLLHDLVIREGFQIQLLWEFIILIHLFILESVEIEQNTLQMDNQNRRSLSKQSSLKDIYLLGATFTGEVSNLFTLNKLLPRMLD